MPSDILCSAPNPPIHPVPAPGSQHQHTRTHTRTRTSARTRARARTMASWSPTISPDAVSENWSTVLLVCRPPAPLPVHS